MDMTDDEKLKRLDEYEEAAWDGLERSTPVPYVESFDLKNIERCQRIRANLRSLHFGSNEWVVDQTRKVVEALRKLSEPDE